MTQLIAAEFAKEGRVVWQYDYAVGYSVRRRNFGQAHLAGLRIDTPDVVRLFIGKPENAVVVEYRRVRIDLRAIGWAILGNASGLRIKLTKLARGNGGEPNVAIFIRDQPVRTGVRRLQRVFFKFASLRIQPAQLVRSLTCVPQRAIGSDSGIMRTRLRCWHIVFHDAYIQRSCCGGGKERGGYRKQAQFA